MNNIEQTTYGGNNAAGLLKDILSALQSEGLKPSGSGEKYTAFCPLHNDRETKSLSVGIGKTQPILLHCLAQCSTYQQLADWLSAKGVVFPKKASTPDGENQVWKSITVEAFGEFRFKWDADKADPVMEKLYVYRRKDGTPYAFKMRFTPKTFRRFAFKPDGKIKASWAGIEMDPYNWDIVCKAAAEGRTIVAVEGEKDCDNVVEHLRYPCFSAGGVSDKWEERWNEDLRGCKGIVNVYDNDLVKGNAKQPGYKKGEVLSTQLKAAGFPIKGMMFEQYKDTTEFIEAGGTRKDFDEIIKNTPVWVPKEKSEMASKCDRGNSEIGSRKTDAEIAKGVSHKDLLMACCAGIDLWHDSEQNGFATIASKNGIAEHLPLQSKAFKQWLSYRCYSSFDITVQDAAISECLAALTGKAVHEAREEKPEVRLAHVNGKIFCDLNNEKRDIVEISDSRWTVLPWDQCAVKFIRPKTLQALPVPERNGSLDSLFALMNLTEKSQQVLLAAWMVGVFMPPTGTFPILVLTGEQGTGKTFSAKTIKRFLDPVKAPARALPEKEQDVAIAAKSNFVLNFDNLSGLPAKWSDIFCRIASGTGFGGRELYSDANEVVFDIHRPLMINGIDEPTTREDFNDRALSLKLPTIPETKKKTEKELEADFSRIHSTSLGALFDAVSAALSFVDSVTLEKQVRMADFLTWATAAEPALGLEPSEVYKAYTSMRQDLVNDMLETSALAQAVLRRYKGEEVQESATNILRNLVKPEDIDAPNFPKNPKQLSDQLRRLAPALRKTGCSIEWSRTREHRLISIRVP